MPYPEAALPSPGAIDLASYGCGLLGGSVISEGVSGGRNAYEPARLHRQNSDLPSSLGYDGRAPRARTGQARAPKLELSMLTAAVLDQQTPL